MSRKGIIALIFVATLAGTIAIARRTSGFQWLDLFGGGGPADTLLISGNIEAHESVLSFKTVQSRIVDLPFDEGQWVRKGALIARVEDADYRQNVATAQAALEQSVRQAEAAKANVDAAQKALIADEADLQQKNLDYKRYQELWLNHSVSTQMRDLAETAFKVSRAAFDRDRAMMVAAQKNQAAAEAAIHNAEESLRLAKIILGYTTLTAPFDGVILVRQSELGEVMLPSAPVVTIADLDHVWMRGYVNETDIGRVRFGQTASITSDAFPGREFPGRISSIASRAEFTPKSVETHTERVTLVYRIKIDVFNPTHELVPGMPVDALIHLSSDQTQGN
ncbi:MAG TPA: efflux RND transporter periplasmic adaptor subunit [Candidatus Binataceae bacterium]|nr:efflux RND transporter periplasmic adaptor subunit [Candidatus Binataceae bacterium]